MKFKEAVSRCKVRGYIMRDSYPERKYWKNHTLALAHRVPWEDQLASDWDHYDPEGEATSIVG